MVAVMDLNVLALNRSYIPVGIITVQKAFKKLISNRANVVHVTDIGYYEDHDITSWAEFSILKKMIGDEASGLEDWINSSEEAIEAPRIIRYLDYDKIYSNRIRFSRKNIFIRDHYKCQYCGKVKSIKRLQLEHVIPKSKGGKTTWLNTVCACDECNDKKRDRTPEEAGMKIIRKPFTPRFLPTQTMKAFSWDKDKYGSWENFVSNVYWNIELSEE